ncbi:unnamed protein product [Vitrella brassicaformis CCMP3155]|uniref:Uncharacterized protein n=1 Tax=Vitrella brassicaformis (strain CCMP3155) TaxID=1169540 RepID=A0A0G4ERP0_VITBC|nr:unnamed protein product [Vitrella brassicaformis CCMP3155]|eukprot:CEM00506.1 unnamed protein product [Vitrella brassicaformis CCMP3155]
MTQSGIDWTELGGVNIEFDDELEYSDVSRQLAEAIICRTVISADEVTQRLQRQGADADASVALHLRTDALEYQFEQLSHYPLLALAIDNKSGGCIPSVWGSVWACFQNDGVWDESSGFLLNRPLVLPQWSSPQLERDIMTALLNGGADVNQGRPHHHQPTMPIRVAIAAGSEAAFNLLMQHQANVHGVMVMELPHSDSFGRSAPSDYEHALLAMYRRLIQQDSTLATEVEQAMGGNLVHHAARNERGYVSQGFIDAYLDLVVENGASITATRNIEWTPLHDAASMGSPCSADYLCRRLPPNEIDTPTSGVIPNRTALATAADRVDRLEGDVHMHEDLHDEQLDRQYQEMLQSSIIPNIKATIRTLLRTGADITRMPIATEADRRKRQLVLTEYTTVLNELPNATMSAINDALRPQRDHSMRLGRLLPLAPHHDGAHPHPSPSNMAFGPHEAEGIAWKIGAFLHEPSAASAAIDEYLIGDSQLRRRVRAAVNHFVKSAATQTSSNREVVGGTRYEQQGDKRVKVTVPPLKCFAIRAAGSGGQVVNKMTGVREVVHKARLDEVAKYQLTGVQKGFNEHLGDQDCQFGWGQLGRLSRTGLFIPLGIE